MWTRKRITTEEEEDRARSLITRRRFLFLGAAAAGAAILKPPALWTPPESPIIDQWADYSPVIPAEALEYQRQLNKTLDELTGAYFAKDALRNLKAHSRLLELTQLRHLPERTSVKLFMYTGKDDDLCDGVQV